MAARSALSASGIENISEVAAHFAEQWHIMVTLGQPVTHDRIAAIQATLVPATVDVVWYEGSFDAVPNELVDDSFRPNLYQCGVCATEGPTRPHLVEPGAADASIAVATHWFLCDVCHGAVERHDSDDLLSRLAIGGLREPEASEIAEALLRG